MVFFEAVNTNTRTNSFITGHNLVKDITIVFGLLDGNYCKIFCSKLKWWNNENLSIRQMYYNCCLAFLRLFKRVLVTSKANTIFISSVILTAWSGVGFCGFSLTSLGTHSWIYGEVVLRHLQSSERSLKSFTGHSRDSSHTYYTYRIREIFNESSVNNVCFWQR